MKFFLIYVILFSSSLFSKDLYSTKQIEMRNDEGKVIATITKGTKIKILKEYKNKLLVQVKGWSYEEEPNNEIFFKYGVTVILATIVDRKLAKAKIIETKEDEYEEVWIQNSIKGFITNKNLTENFMALWKTESSLANQRCSGCHGTLSPHSYFAGEFPSIIDSMAEQAGLSKEEKPILINYFQKRNIYKK